MNSANNAHHHPQYSLQQQHLAAQQQRGAPQSSVPYPTSSSAAVPPHMSSPANGPAHYQQHHQQQPHHGQMQQQHPPTTSTQQSGYNNTVVNGTDRSRPRGVTGGGEDDEQLQQHRRRRSRSNNRRTATTASTTDRRTNGESAQADQLPPGGQYHYPAGVGVSNNVTPPSQDTTAGPGGGSGNLTNQTNSSTSALDAAQRRPSYLLHRDLVIGKGSYGQVCIASRGEAEGHHSSSRSGKRKKFACKCVMLRNDPKYIAKLQEEVNVLRELRGHDNVIRLFDVFCVDNELFIITELGRGGDLFHLLTTHPKHGVTEAYAGEFINCIASLPSRFMRMSAFAPLPLFISDLPPHSLFVASRLLSLSLNHASSTPRSPQPKLWQKCSRPYPSFTPDTFVIVISNLRIGSSNPARTYGAPSSSSTLVYRRTTHPVID